MVQIGILAVGLSSDEMVLLQELLQDYSLWSASGEEEAVRCVKKHPSIQIVFVDLSIGLSFIQSLVTYPVCSIVVGSASALGPALALGATDYLCRPFTLEMVKHRLSLHTKGISQSGGNIWFDSLLWQAPVGIAVYSGLDKANMEMVRANAKLLEIMGRSKEELMNTDWRRITHPDDLEREMVPYAKFSRHEISSYELEKRFIKPDGSLVWVSLTVSRLFTDRKEMDDYIGIVKDITEQKELEYSLRERERAMHSYLSQLPGMAYRCCFDEHWTMEFVSSGCTYLTGYSPAELIDNRLISYNEVIAPRFRKNVRDEWLLLSRKDSPFIQEYEIITKDGQKKWAYDTGRGILDDEGNIAAIEGMLFDITIRKQQELTLAYFHTHDEWTELPNRRNLVSFLETIKQREGKALLAVNLTAVHTLSLSHGFLYSRNLVKRIATLLHAQGDTEHMLFSSYEYQLIFFIDNDVALAAFAKRISRLVASILREERVGWGIGVVSLSDIPFEEILTNLLVASEAGLAEFDTGKVICFFDEAMQEAMQRRTRLEKELALLIKDPASSSFYLQFQPVWGVKNQRITDFEALSRWESPLLGKISPSKFIEIAEKARLIVPLGRIIVEKALQFLSLLEREGFGDIRVSINISAIQLMHKGFLQMLMNSIERAQVNANNITLEVTESVFISKFQEVNDLFFTLQQRGISIAIDDFGTGYSTLSRERELNVNCLKIDKAFIDKLAVLEDKDAITADIISLAHKLGHTVVAEGVECEEQWDYLKRHGCDKIQGFLFSKPLDTHDALSLLKKTNRT
ncbi:MAG: EAL domain-containing protein [Sphaerochaeta sp.]